MDGKKTLSTPPRKDKLDDEGESSASKDEIIARLMKQNAEYKKRLDEEERNLSKTKFLDFLHVISERVYSKFTVETDRSLLAQGTTSVAGKFCPRRLCFWADFGALHDQKFQELNDSLNPLGATFPPPYDINGYLSAFSPKSKNEATLRPFLRIALEKPAAAVINRHLHATSNDPHAKPPNYVHFTDSDKTTFTTQSSKSKPPPGTGVSAIPDRVCMYDPNQETKTKVRFLVGEYKAAHRLTAPKLAHMLESPPEDFLMKAARIDKTVPLEDAPNDVVFSKKYPTVYLAKALCQAYDYMIAGALEYGYIATGYGLLMLHVLPGDLDTLYYYCVTFALEGAKQTTLLPKETAVAYMSTLVLLAMRDKAPSNEDMAAWAKGRMLWPGVKYKGGKVADLKKSDDDDDDDNDDNDGNDNDEDKGGGDGGGGDGGGGGGGGGGSGGKKKGTKRVRMGSTSNIVVSRKKPGGAGEDSVNTAAAQGRPLALDLPYCTQACLLGVVDQLPLDEKCPNVELHRAASLREHGEPGRHPLTEAGIRTALQAQAKAAETDPTQCCVPTGHGGRYGSMVRVAVAVAGYVFVAKAAYIRCVESLEHEQRVYQALKACQGKLIPVCLGVMTFMSARFTSDCLMRSLLFLSYAGRDLGKPERLPINVDLQTAMDRTADELYALGLRNSDVRVYNCAWNPETRRVLHFDFDQATMAAWGEEKEEEGDKETAAATVDGSDGVVKEDNVLQEQVQEKRSPLLKRSVNTLGKRMMEGQSTAEGDAKMLPRLKKRRANA